MSTGNQDLILGVSVDASDASRGFEDVSRAANKMAGEVAQASIKAGKGIDGIGDGASTSANNLDKATRNMIGSIQRTTAAMEAGQRGTTKYYEAIANQRGVSQDALRPYLAQLDQAIAKQKQASASMNSMGLSAGQLSNAMRGVSSQFTDIVVSLQSGQAPMTVLMQQGGQLKDMFGGIGNAAKALGGYVLGLISPFTVLAAGVGTLGFAAYQGSKEADELAKSLIMTGNAAGTSVDQLKNMASAVSEATGATKGAAVDALTQIASSGKVAASNMTLVAEAAIAMQKATGAAVEDTVKQFSELGKSPVEASLKLNEQYNYLTASVYRQIKALEDQGRQTEAVTLAQETYAKSVKEQANQIRQDLGGLESAWKSVGNFAKSAWDKMLNVGREGSISDQIATLKKQLTTGSFHFALTEGDIKSQIASLEKKLASETQVTAEKAKQSELDRYGIEWAKEGDKYLSKKQQMEQEITKARNQGIAAGASELEITKRIAAIREKFTEKTSRSGKSQIEKDADALKVLLDKLHGTEDNAFSSDYVTNVEKLIKGWSAGTLKIEQFRVEMGRLVAMQPGVKALAKETEELAKTRDKYAQGISKETESLIKKAEAAEYENAKIGMTADQLEYLTRARYADEIATKQNEAAMIESIWGRNSEVEAIEKQIDALKRLQGAEVARPKLQAQAKEWEKFSDDINRALTDALMRGFEDGKSFGQNFVDSLKNSLKTAALKIVVNMVTSTGGSLANAAINAVAGTSSANDGAGANYFGLANNANSVYSLYGAGTQFFTGASTGSSSAGLMYANGTQMVGGDGIGALYTANGGWAGVDAGTGAASGAVAGEGAGVTGGSSAAGTIAWVAAIVMGMKMSSDAWKAGVRWDGTYDFTNDPLKAGPSGPHHQRQDTVARSIFGDDFADSEFFAVMSGNALSQQVHNMAWGGQITTGVPDMTGRFSEAGNGFTGGKTGREVTEHGGWFTSTKRWWEWQDISPALDKQMDIMYLSISDTLLGVGELFGDSTMLDKIKNFSLDIRTASNGGTFQVIAEQLTEAMGNLFFPSVQALRKAASEDGKTAAESWSQALGRIMQETQAVSRIFDMMGKDLVETFGKNNADSILKASDNLVTLFGTIDSLNASFGAYYGNFYTAEEQTAQAWKDMGKAFDIIGLALPKTRQEFRSLVDGLDLTTVSGEVTFKRLMDLQSGFAALTPAMEDVAAATTEIIDAAGRKSWGDKLAVLTGQKTQSQVDRDNTLASTSDAAVQAIMRLVFAQEDLATAAELTADAVSAAADETKQIAEAMRVATMASFDRDRASNDAYKSSIQAFSTSGLAAITEAVSLEKQRIGVIRSVAAESVASIKGVFSLLENQVSDLYGTVASTQAMQASEGSAFIASALQNALSSGYLPDQSALSSAISGARSGLDANNFATQFEADRAALVMAGQLSQLRAVAGLQLPATEQAVKLADEQLKALDTSLTYYKKQLDSLNGIKEGTADLTGTVEEIGQSVIAKITAMNANFSSLSDALLNNIVTASKSGSISASDTTAELGKSGVAADKAALVGGSAVFTSSNGATLIDGVFRGTNGYQGSITDAKAIITEAFNGLSAKEFQSRAIGIGLSAAMIDYMYSFDAGWTNSWAKQNGLPAFAVGTNYVPQDMVAKIHEGEAIIPKAYNPALGNNNSRLEKLVEGLTAEVQRLQSIVDTGNKHASRTANAVNGNPEQPMLVETV